MEYVRYLFRFLYRIRWWLIIGTALVTAIAIFLTNSLSKTYNVSATLYTGIVSGYSIEETGGKTDWAATQNAMDNLINIIKAESTLKRVSIRLFARVLIEGNSKQDNGHITATSYNLTYNHVKNSPNGKEILALIDKKSEDKTVENLMKYERPTRDNYIYGLFYYNHPYYSYDALKRIIVNRKGSSDLLEVSYSSNDPGIAYNTILILTEEFVNEYNTIRYGETDKVIEYFKGELARIGKELRVQEDSLTDYNIEKRVINYGDETKEIAAVSKEYELREQDVLFAYNSSKAMMEELEKRMDMNAKQAINSIQLINKLKEASGLTGKITEMETISGKEKDGHSLQSYKDRLSQTRKDLSEISDNYITHQFSKEGLSRQTIVDQWLDQILLFEKAKAELQIVQQSRQDLNDKYAFFAPIGSTIKRQERTIGFTEQNYLTVLQSYNEALMRKKNLEMTSATLKVLNSPAYPINAEPTARKKIIMAACAGSFLFILGFFFLIELLDRTLRDSIRTQRLTGCRVLGAFPYPTRLKYRGYNAAHKDIATRYLSSTILRFFVKRKPNKPYIVNFLSTESQSGKSYLSEEVLAYWGKIGLKVRKLTWDKDFDTHSRTYMLAQSVGDLYSAAGEDVLIVEYPALLESNVPDGLLQEAHLNLLIAPANRGWKETDKLLLKKLKSQVGDSPLHLYLNQAAPEVVEDYTAMLPPYTFMRKLAYRFSQLALTEKTILKVTGKSLDDEDDD